MEIFLSFESRLNPEPEASFGSGCLGEKFLTLIKERKIKNTAKLEVGQVWAICPEQKNADSVLICILDAYADGAAYIVILHNEKQLRTRVEPLVVLNFCDKPEQIAVVERTLSVSGEVFQGSTCLGKICPEQVAKIIKAKRKSQRIFLDSSMLQYLEVHNPQKITDKLKAKAAKTALFMPIGGSVKELVALHFRLQSAVQKHHEKFIFS